MSKRISAQELEHCGFVNAIIDVDENGDDLFREMVMQEVHSRLGDHLIRETMTEIKRLIQRPELDVLEGQNVSEVFAGLERFLTGVPQKQFGMVARGEKRHKL